MAILRGNPLVFSVPDIIRPIVNVPGWATQVRVRVRTGELIRVYLRGARRIECWFAEETSEGWKLVFQQGRNVALNPPSAPTDVPTPENRA